MREDVFFVTRPSPKIKQDFIKILTSDFIWETYMIFSF